MPRGKTNYNAVLSFPEVTVPYQHPSGQMVLYSIWNEVGSRKGLIKCDLCGQLLPLTNTRLPTWLHHIEMVKHAKSKQQRSAKEILLIHSVDLELSKKCGFNWNLYANDDRCNIYVRRAIRMRLYLP